MDSFELVKHKKKIKQVRRCEHCGELLKSKWCNKCQKNVDGYYPDSTIMPPKRNKKAWVELGKSAKRLYELKHQIEQPESKKKSTYTINCYICGIECEVNKWMFKSTMPRCDNPECHKKVRSMQYMIRNKKSKAKRKLKKWYPEKD